MDALNLEQFARGPGSPLIAFGEKKDPSGIHRGGNHLYPLQAFDLPGARTEIGPSEELTAGQAVYDPRKVAKFADHTHASHSVPKLYQHEDGERVVMDGHHRLIADRLQGRSTPVDLVTHEDLKR
jgi:hypothetical protein